MIPTQGQNPINGSSNPTEIFPISESARHAENIAQNKKVDGVALEKRVIFACHKCNGALVPLESCPVCERTSFRKCVDCGNEISSGNHQTCNYLVTLSDERATNRKIESRKL